MYRRETSLLSSGKKFHPKVFIGVGRLMGHFPVLENEKWRVAKTDPSRASLYRASLSIPSLSSI